MQSYSSHRLFLNFREIMATAEGISDGLLEDGCEQGAGRIDS